MTEAFSRPRCLVVEDQALIGLALEAYLEDRGYAVGGPFPSHDDALAWLDLNTAEVAILDFKLRDGCATRLAEELTSRGIPFLVYSGRKRGPDLPAVFREVPWIEKPCDRPALLQAVATIIGNQ